MSRGYATVDEEYRTRELEQRAPQTLLRRFRVSPTGWRNQVWLAQVMAGSVMGYGRTPLEMTLQISGARH